ncbi:MAG: PP2C family protein-serine/threonine phosphatase [Myxococcales bacterium]|nr:serine/threonine-protein phosphatase [Myxococcota bacterium]MDW8283087.1 PP2C family protein-serine/threonine phosphatase [Myxococcales bacterium]
MNESEPSQPTPPTGEQGLALLLGAGGLVCLALAAFVSIADGPSRRHQTTIQRIAAEATRSRAEKRAAHLAARMLPTLSAGDHRRLQAEVQLAASVSPEIVEVGVIDLDMTVLASSEADRVGKGPPAAVLRVAQGSIERGDVYTSEDLAGQRVLLAVPMGKPQRLAMLYMIKSTAALEDDLSRVVAAQPVRVPVWVAIGLGSLGLVSALALLLLLDRQRRREVSQIEEMADRLAQGDFQVRLDPMAVPHLASTAERLNLAAEHAHHLQQVAHEGNLHASRIAEELENAQVVQQTLMPDVRRISRGALQLCGVYRSVSKLSGDWWHYYPLDDNRTLLVLADVLGHGIGAAVVGAMAYGCAAQLHLEHHSRLRPETLLAQLNRVIWSSARGKYTMSCFAAVIDTKECLLTYASGAHAFPLLFRSRDARKPFIPLVAAGAPLGSTESPEFAASTQAFEPGDLLICYTDGLIEAVNEAGEPFGDKRVRQVVQRCHGRNVEEICETILAEVSRFVGSAGLDDDQTLVVARNAIFGSHSSWSHPGS